MSTKNRFAGIENIEDICELTPMQRGLMFHSLFDPESTVYIEQVVCVLRATLDEDRLRMAFERVVERHGVLRTAYHWRELAKPLQVVMKHVEVLWQSIDWRSLTPLEQVQRANSWIEADRRVGFDLERAPAMRCALLRLADRSYRLVWTFHHLMIDGWSLAIVFKELFQAYEELAAGSKAAVRKVRPYRDYVLWRHSYKDPEGPSFWHTHLAGIEIPPRITATSIISNTAEHGKLSREITAGVERQLRQLARAQRMTPQVIVSGALAVALARWSGQSDVIFGRTVSGRPAELEFAEEMVGLFINAVPLRVRVNRESQVLPWLRCLQEDQLEVDRHAHESLIDIHGWSEVPAGIELFELLLVFENYPAPKDWGSETVRVVTMRALERTNYPLTLSVTTGKTLSFDLDWDRSKFTTEQAHRFLDHLLEILTAIVSNPLVQVGELVSVPERDKRLLLGGWCAGLTIQAEGYLQNCASAIAERDPARVAIMHAGTTWTYRDLERRANGLAWRLRAAGVGPEVCVGISLGQTPALLVAVLGVLKAGGAYLPIESELPRERIRWMLQESGVHIIVCDAEELVWVEDEGVRLERIDRLEDANDAPGTSSLPDQLAYVMYTSGSTGKPKGVGVSRASVENLVAWYCRSLAKLNPVKTLIVSSFGFDLTQKNFFATFVMGGAVHFPLRPHFAGFDIGQQIAREQITLLNCTPSALYLLLDANSFDDYRALSSLQYVVLGGEAVLRPRIARWLQSPHCRARVMNGYGPTECTDICADHWIDIGCDDEGRLIPFGRPNWNARLYVLDGEMQLVPVGTLGELYIGGIGVARGYVGRSGLTAERFVPDPFSTAGGERLYRSGDIVRYRANGDLEFLGRRDAQVKLRGHRIELGEIEATILSHPGVGEAVVQIEKDGSGHPRLVSYVVAKAGQAAPAAEDLKRHTRRWLPNVMVPTGWMTLDKLPLTLNGKIDRGQLRRMHDGASPAEAMKAPAKPISLLEGRLAAIWSEVLDIPSVGIEDNFFDLGGHSLNATSVISRIYQRLGMDVPLRRLFEAPTIAQLAALIEPSLDSKKAQREAPLGPLPRSRNRNGATRSDDEGAPGGYLRS